MDFAQMPTQCALCTSVLLVLASLVRVVFFLQAHLTMRVARLQVEQGGTRTLPLIRDRKLTTSIFPHLVHLCV